MTTAPQHGRFTHFVTLVIKIIVLAQLDLLEAVLLHARVLRSFPTIWCKCRGKGADRESSKVGACRGYFSVTHLRIYTRRPARKIV